MSGPGTTAQRVRASAEAGDGGFGTLRELDAVTWLRAVPISLIAGVVIAIPSDLIDNPIFGRPVPVRPIDYVILTATAALIGLILAIRPRPAAAIDSATAATAADQSDRQDTRTMLGGFVSFLAVGCPVCNQLVVALVGTSGALSWWAPVQPFVGLTAVGLLLYTLRMRLRTYRLATCPVPDASRR